MNIKLENLTLKQLLNVERCVYNTDYEFTDDQFRAFVENQLEFIEIDNIELKIQDEEVYIVDDVLYFNNLIEQGEYLER